MKIYIDGFWGSVSAVVTLNFHLGVHLTFKSNMAAFDLCRGTTNISNNFPQYSSMCMYSADFSYTEVLMIAESIYDKFFSFKNTFDFSI